MSAKKGERHLNHIHLVAQDGPPRTFTIHPRHESRRLQARHVATETPSIYSIDQNVPMNNQFKTYSGQPGQARPGHCDTHYTYTFSLEFDPTNDHLLARVLLLPPTIWSQQQ